MKICKITILFSCFSIIFSITNIIPVQAQCGTCACPPCTKASATIAQSPYGRYAVACTSTVCSPPCPPPPPDRDGGDGGDVPSGGMSGGSNDRGGGYDSSKGNGQGASDGKGTDGPGSNGNGSCFLTGTQITMANGTTKNIEDVRIGDLILAYDELSGKTSPDFVSQVSASFSDHYYILDFSDGTQVKPTQWHPFLTDQGWKSMNPAETLITDGQVVEQLTVGDRVLQQDGSWTTLLSAQKVQGEVTVYNLNKVKKYQTFFANGLCVHNKP